MQKIMKSTQDTFNVTNNAHKIKMFNLPNFNFNFNLPIIFLI